MLTIYSKSACPACLSTAALLDKYNVPYNTIKIDEDSDAKEFVLGQGHRSVPQIYCDGTLFVKGGWNDLMKMSKDDIEERISLYVTTLKIA